MKRSSPTKRAVAPPVALWDVQCGFGGAVPGRPERPTAQELLAVMDRLAIAAALVRLAPEGLDVDVAASNDLLCREARRHSRRLIPCPTVLPAAVRDVAPEPEQVRRLVAAGARAVVIRPQRDVWSLEPWSADPLFKALARHRLPVLCAVGEVPLEQVARLAERHRRVPLVVFDTQYRQLRVLAPLLKAFPNVHLSLGSNFTVHLGIERLVAVVGPRQLLFGTGYPAVEPAMAIGMLMYANIAGRDRALIGAGNLRRLLAEVRP